jgi:ATP-dependent Lon protease
MNDAKIQILQLLGQWVSNPSALGSAIGIYGPPGTAKTTIVKTG